MKDFHLINEGRAFADFVKPYKLIGKGSFARVYELDDQRVLKLTCDPANAAVLCHQSRTAKPGRAFPVVFEDLGRAAECADCSYYGCVMERLQWPVGDRAEAVIQTSVEVRRRYDAEACSSVVDAAFLRALSRHRDLDMRGELLQLARMVESDGWLVDRLDRGNLLARSDGQLVLSDLLYSLVPFKRVSRSFSPS